MTKCEGCVGPFMGIRVSLDEKSGMIQNNGGDGTPIERCDLCKVYESDYAAQFACMTLLVVRANRK